MNDWEKDIEERLASQPLQLPSPALEGRMEAAFARAQRRPWWERPVKLWQCAAACAVFLLLGLGIQTLRESPEPPIVEQQTVYIFPQQNGNVFDATAPAWKPLHSNLRVIAGGAAFAAPSDDDAI
jgi:hypothetical protein